MATKAADGELTKVYDRATEQIRQLLSDGVRTPDHYLYMMRVDEVDQPVGLMWFAVTREGVNKIWV